MRLEAEFNEHRKHIEANLHESRKCLEANLGSLHVVTKTEFESYDGSYEVTPKLYEQTLETAEKVMKHDMTIKEIPITTVSNTSGGKTVIIGG